MMANVLSGSDFTSIQIRIKATLGEEGQQAQRLMPFVGNPRQDSPKGLPFRLADYLELVD